MKKACNVGVQVTNVTWNKKGSTNDDKRGNEDQSMKLLSASFETTQVQYSMRKTEFGENLRGQKDVKTKKPATESYAGQTKKPATERYVAQTKKPATARYVAEFHPLSYLFTVVRGNLEDDCDKDGNPRIPTAIPGVLNRRLARELRAKIVKMNREIEDIQKRIDGMHEKVNLLNKERREPESNSNKGRNFGNEIYLLVRNVGMWMRRMETKAQLIERIEWSIYILKALQEIDKNCNAKMFWSYASWRKIQHKIGPGGTSSDWDNDLGNNGPKYDKYKSDSPEIIRLFNAYETAYRRNIEISKLIKDDLIRTGSEEKLSRFFDDNYTRCKGCRALFCQRYDDLFGTRIHCPSKTKARENLMTRGTTGEEDGSNLIVCFYCTDCFDVFNPSIIKTIKRDKELKIEKDLEVLIQEHRQEQNDNKNSIGNNSSSNNKSNKKRKKKKRKKNKKNSTTSASPTLADGTHRKNWESSSTLTTTTTITTEKSNDIPTEEQPSDNELEVDEEAGLTLSSSNDESQKSSDDLDEKENENVNGTRPGSGSGTYDGDTNSKGPDVDVDVDSSMNDVWVDYLIKTGSIIELNAFMDRTLGIEKD